MKIAVSMIAQNEEKFIGPMIASCDFADYIVIVDGGSTDGTRLIVEKNMPEDTKLIWQEVPWANDFGAQRQHSLNLVPAYADWWIRGDADEIFSAAIRKGLRVMLSLLPEEIIAVRIRQTNFVYSREFYDAANGGFETWPRIFKNIRLPDGANAMKWVDPIHEHVKFLGPTGLHDIPTANTVTWSAQVYHQGWLSDERRLDRENLYEQISGSRPDLVDRDHTIRVVPESQYGPVTS